MKTIKKTKSAKKTKKLTALEEFETRDLSGTLKKYQSIARWVKLKTKPTSIALPEATIQILREKAQRKGIGYQTLLKMIVQEHLAEY